jgi:hypothetical protein
VCARACMSVCACVLEQVFVLEDVLQRTHSIENIFFLRTYFFFVLEDVLQRTHSIENIFFSVGARICS